MQKHDSIYTTWEFNTFCVVAYQKNGVQGARAKPKAAQVDVFRGLQGMHIYTRSAVLADSGRDLQSYSLQDVIVRLRHR